MNIFIFIYRLKKCPLCSKPFIAGHTGVLVLSVDEECDDMDQNLDTDAARNNEPTTDSTTDSITEPTRTLVDPSSTAVSSLPHMLPHVTPESTPIIQQNDRSIAKQKGL